MVALVASVVATLAFAGPVGRPAACVSKSSPPTSMSTVPYFAVDGSQIGEEDIALRASSKPMYVVHRKVMWELNNRRQGTASTKTRSEVSGGGRKPYKQKGTGRARRGSTRSPLIVGGGVSHGPKPKDWSTKMNKKERRVAMASAIMGVLSRAVVVDDFDGEVTVPKTSALLAVLKRLPLDFEWSRPSCKVVLIARELVRAPRGWLGCMCRADLALPATHARAERERCPRRPERGLPRHAHDEHAQCPRHPGSRKGDHHQIGAGGHAGALRGPLGCGLSGLALRAGGSSGLRPHIHMRRRRCSKSLGTPRLAERRGL